MSLTIKKLNFVVYRDLIFDFTQSE